MAGTKKISQLDEVVNPTGLEKIEVISEGASKQTTISKSTGLFELALNVLLAADGAGKIKGSGMSVGHITNAAGFNSAVNGLYTANFTHEVFGGRTLKMLISRSESYSGAAILLFDDGSISVNSVDSTVNGTCNFIAFKTDITDIIASAPAALDTLNELAAALGDDANFAATITTALGNKVDKVTGKALSSNDYTDAEKARVAQAAIQVTVDDYTISEIPACNYDPEGYLTSTTNVDIRNYLSDANAAVGSILLVKNTNVFDYQYIGVWKVDSLGEDGVSPFSLKQYEYKEADIIHCVVVSSGASFLKRRTQDKNNYIPF